MSLGADERNALSGLVHRYAAGVDDRQFGSLPGLFTPDAELLLPDPPAILEPVLRHRGHRAIGEAIARVAAAIRTRHAIVGEVYDEGSRRDAAHGRIAGVAHHWIRHHDQIRDVVWHLRYDDEYQQLSAAQWRIHRRALTIDAIDIRPITQVRPAAPG